MVKVKESRLDYWKRKSSSAEIGILGQNLEKSLLQHGLSPEPCVVIALKTNPSFHGLQTHTLNFTLKANICREEHWSNI